MYREALAWAGATFGSMELMSLGSKDEMSYNSKDQFLLWNNVGEQTLFD